MNLFSTAALKMAVTKQSSLTPEARAGLLAPYDSWANRVAVHRFVQDIPASPSHPTWKTLEQIEAGLSQFADRPSQLIWGMDDWCFRPQCIERFTKHWPNAGVLRLPEVGHWVVEESHPQIVECLSDFWGQSAPV